MQYDQLILQKNGEVTPAPGTPSILDFSSITGGYLRLLPNGQLTALNQQQDQQARQGNLADNLTQPVTDALAAHEVGFITGLIGVVLVSVSLIQIVKPI